MKLTKLAIFLILLTAATAFAQQKDVAGLLQESAALIQAGNFNAAGPLLRKATTLAPKNADAHNLLGIVLDQAGKTVEAEREYRTAIRLNPKAFSPLSNLGVLLAKSTRKTEAIRIFETVIRLAPDHPAATINLGFLYNTVGNYPKAVEYLKKANIIQPNTYDIIFNLGTALYNLKSFDEAAQNLAAASAVSPESAEPVYWLGMIAFDRNQDELAENYFERSITLHPDYTEANFMLGELHMKYKLYSEAKNYYELVLKHDTTKPVYYIRLGGAYLFLKDFEHALEVFKKASMSFPKIPEIHYFLAITAHGSGNFDLALDAVKKSLAIKETADSDSLFGSILADRNETVEAEKYLRKALLLNPKHFNSLNDLGRLLVKNRRFAEAIPILQIADRKSVV